MSAGSRAFEAPKPCPDCGMEYMDFRKTGRLGCAGDYTAFRTELDKILDRLQRAGRHCGKRPHGRTVGSAADYSEWRKLRRRMAEAVADRRYEHAAELRDALRRKDEAHET